MLAPDVGGGFGPKGAVYHEELLVPAVALRLGRPVKWVEGRREHFAATGHDREQVHRARIAFRRDGTIVAIDDVFLADVGAYPIEGTGLTLNTVNHMPGPYRVPNYRSVGTSYVTNKTHNTAYRGAGRPEAVFVMERLLDIGARRLGLDPVEIRRRNLVQPGEMPYRSGITYKDGVTVAYDPGDFPAGLERALELLRYAELRARQATQRRTARRIGLGVACYVQGSGIGPYEGAQVRVDPSGQVFVTIGVAAQGQGHQTTLAQICAAELGVRLEDVHIVAGDTQLFPIGMGTGGSRVAANTGPAVARTAREVRARAQQVAAELLECAPGGRSHRGRPGVRGRGSGARGHARPDRPRRHSLQGPPQDRGARPPAMQLLLPGHRDLGVRHPGGGRRGGRGDLRHPAPRVLGRPRQRARHQSRHRGGPAPRAARRRASAPASGRSSSTTTQDSS